MNAAAVALTTARDLHAFGHLLSGVTRVFQQVEIAPFPAPDDARLRRRAGDADLFGVWV